VTPLLVNLHWLRVPERIQYKLCVLVHRCLNGAAPQYLSELIQPLSDVDSRHRLRSASMAEVLVLVSPDRTAPIEILPPETLHLYEVSRERHFAGTNSPPRICTRYKVSPPVQMSPPSLYCLPRRDQISPIAEMPYYKGKLLFVGERFKLN